jgi:hypothetical protein
VVAEVQKTFSRILEFTSAYKLLEPILSFEATAKFKQFLNV